MTSEIIQFTILAIMVMDALYVFVKMFIDIFKLVSKMVDKIYEPYDEEEIAKYIEEQYKKHMP